MTKSKLFRIIPIFILVVLVLMVALRIYGNRRLQTAAHAFQTEAGPIDLAAYATAKVSETENIAVWLAGGVQGLVIENGERTKLISPMFDVPAEQWKPEQIAALRKVLERNDAAIRLLENSARYNQSSFDLNYSAGAQMRLPEPKLVYYIQASKLLACKARLHIIDKNYQEAARTARILQRIAASLQHEPVLITGLVGHVAEKSYHGIVQQLLSTADPQTLDVMSVDLQHLAAMAQPLPRVIALEGSIMYQSLQSGFPSELELTEPRFRLLPWMYRINRRGVIADALEYDRHLVMRSKLPAKSWIDAEPSVVTNIDPKSLYASLMREHIFSAIERFQAVESARILALNAVQLAIEAKKNGSYPASEFVAKKNIRSPYTDEHVDYVVAPDGSATLSFPESDRFWLRRGDAFWFPQKPLFTWKLPTPSSLDIAE